MAAFFPAKSSTGPSTSSSSNNIGSSSSSSSSSSPPSPSPIYNMAQDHLFAILLLLPIDSILSFSTTCKRFRSQATSDVLWESVCKREWGATAVEALKSCFNSQQLPWMRLYKQVSKPNTVSCYKLSDPHGQSVAPSPRASHSLNFVSDFLVLFGGGCEGGRHLDDTWVAYVGNDFKGNPKWQKLSSGIPSGRFGHTCVVVGDYLVLFGGINDCGVRHNDTWLGRFVFSDNDGITLSWRMLDVGSISPPPRGAHAACCIDKTNMVIQGGIGPHGLRLGDTWVLELSDNFSTGSWHQLVVHPSPPARSGHSLTCIEGTGIILFGGRGLGYEVLNDVWLLQMSDGQLKWVQMLYELPDIPERLALPRVGHSASLILGGWLLIYGGEDSSRHRKDDFWVLDIRAIQSSKGLPTALNSIALQANVWRRLKAMGSRPNRRSFHRACVDHSGRYLFVFGGMVDGLLQHSEAGGLRFDGELFLVDLVSPL